MQELEEPSFSEISLHEEPIEAPSELEPEILEELAEPEPEFSAPTPKPEPKGAELEPEEDLILGEELEPLAPAPSPAAPAATPQAEEGGDRLRSEIKSVLSYLDKLLDSLPEEKIEEFARSEYFDTYKKLFEELGLV